jgi:hypothetical protein
MTTIRTAKTTPRDSSEDGSSHKGTSSFLSLLHKILPSLPRMSSLTDNGSSLSKFLGVRTPSMPYYMR